MQEKDLVYLSYASNTCYPTVTDKPPPGVAVNIEDRLWTFRARAYKINSGRRCDPGSRGGPIGVYDKSSAENLARMVRDWQEASKEPSSIAFSD